MKTLLFLNLNELKKITQRAVYSASAAYVKVSKWILNNKH